MNRVRLLATLLTIAVILPARAMTPAEAQTAADQAIDYFRAHCAQRGGALWWYTTDLKVQAGEGSMVPKSVIWVQYPGTPAVGEAYLQLYDATGDRKYLEFATAAGEALAWGQLASGGWDYRIDFDPENSKRWYYRRDVEAGDKEPGKRSNVSTLDDDNTQSALRFLMELDKRLEGQHAEIKHTVDYALEALLKAQYPVGCWPQRFSKPADPNTPVLQARYPDDYPKTFPKVDYKDFYTLNDGTLRDCMRTLFLASEIYGDQRFEQAALNGGEFILRAQMPEPQPTWAQQYNHQMEPAWARQFEPASVTGGESVGAMQMLVDLWIRTGDRKWIEPLPRALAWFERSQLPDGQFARFYELHTNKPLYFVKDTYELTYDDSNMPTHYAFKVGSATGVKRVADTIVKNRDALLAAQQRERNAKEWAARAKELEGDVTKAIAALDAEHRWTKRAQIREGRETLVPRDIIDTSIYIRNLRTIAEYLKASKLGAD